MAGLTLGGEAGCQVIRSRGCIVVFQVTTRASGIQTGILSIGMAGGTAQGGVSTGQGELGGPVIKLGSRPLCRGMAKRAILGESSRHVVGIGSLIVIVQVTGSTIAGSAGKAVIGMAL
jgi:hypothetical protein